MSDANPEIAVYRDGKSLTRGVGALPTPAQRCLVRAATCPIDEIEDALREWRSLVDLSGPIDGGSFRLIPTVFHRLQAAGLDDPNRGMFKGVYRRSLVENSRVLDAASPALRALHDVGITPWLVKGAGLVLAGYYPTLAARPMSDVDVVVDSTRRVDAVEVLRSLGYTTLVAERELVDLHAAEFVDASGMGIDAHWHHLHHARSAAADEVITRTFQTIALDGIPVKVPGPTGLLIATVVHGSTSDPEPPVRWLVDAAMILDRDSDAVVWDDVVEFATRFRLARRIERAFMLLAETTGRTVPEATMAALAALPTSAAERLERQVSSVPWNSIRGRVVLLLAAYAGGDRELRHVVTEFPKFLSRRWDIDHVYQMPAAGGRRLMRWLRPRRP